jgi:hypothetical protein
MSEKKGYPFKVSFWSFAAGAAAMLVLTLSAGWLTTQSVVRQKAEAARTDALVPVCVAKAQKDPSWDAGAAFMKESYYSRDSFVEKAGWATMPGSDSADRSVAAACAKALVNVASKPS